MAVPRYKMCNTQVKLLPGNKGKAAHNCMHSMLIVKYKRTVFISVNMLKSVSTFVNLSLALVILMSRFDIEDRVT
jgi:hypothetical protein